MTCKLERPDAQALFNRHIQLFSTTVLGGAEVIPESNEWYAASVNYAVQEEFYAIAEQAWRERDPRLACCENLYDMAARDGVYPRSAISAQGFVKITGVAGTSLPSPLEFSIGDRTYVTAVASGQPTVIAADGTAVFRVRALVPGEAGNLTETEATLINQIGDVEQSAEVCGGTFCNGQDSEECEAFRARYIARLAYNPRATDAWIKAKLLEWPCVTRAITRAGECCQCNQCGGNENCEDCGCQDCGGKLGFYVMFDNAFPCGIAPESVVNEVEEWLFGAIQGYGLGQVEVGICGQIATVTGVNADVFIDINGCATATQITQIEEQITEYFTTISPSQPLTTRTLDAVISGVLGTGIDFSASLSLTDPALGYGNGTPNEDTRHVMVTPCSLEPDCDYMLCLNSITINRPSTTDGSC